MWGAIIFGFRTSWAVWYENTHYSMMALLIIAVPSGLLFKCMGLDFPNGSLFQSAPFSIIANALLGAILFLVMGIMSKPANPTKKKGDHEKPS